MHFERLEASFAFCSFLRLRIHVFVGHSFCRRHVLRFPSFDTNDLLPLTNFPPLLDDTFSSVFLPTSVFSYVSLSMSAVLLKAQIIIIHMSWSSKSSSLKPVSIYSTGLQSPDNSGVSSEACLRCSSRSTPSGADPFCTESPSSPLSFLPG